MRYDMFGKTIVIMGHSDCPLWDANGTAKDPESCGIRCP